MELMPAYEYITRRELSFDRKGIKISTWALLRMQAHGFQRPPSGGTKGFREMTEALHKEGTWS